jgi:hypothetical protein
MKSKIIPFSMTDTSLQRKIVEISADSTKVIITKHAKIRMKERRISSTQVLHVLRKGSLVEPAHQDIHGYWKCTLASTISGDFIKVAAALMEESEEKVIVITVMN